MSPSTIDHGGQYDTKYVTFEQLLHAAFVADTIWGDKLEPARTNYESRFTIATVFVMHLGQRGVHRAENN